MTYYDKIISLVPSLTELLIDLGLAEKLAGRTRFCVRPEEVVENILIIGGTWTRMFFSAYSLST